MSDGRKIISVRVPEDLLELVKTDMRRKGYNSMTDYVLYALSVAADTGTSTDKSEVLSASLADMKAELVKKLDAMNAQNNASNYVLMAMVNMLCEEALTSTQAADVIRAAFTKATDEYTADGLFKYLMQHHKQTQPAASKSAPDFATRQTDENGQELW